MFDLYQTIQADFYPRPPRGGRPDPARSCPPGTGISIHALREEGDSSASPQRRQSSYFYPRPPRGGRQGTPAPLFVPDEISIHALREEGDA